MSPKASEIFDLKPASLARPRPELSWIAQTPWIGAEGNLAIADGDSR